MPLSTPDLIGGARAAAGQHQPELGSLVMQAVVPAENLTGVSMPSRPAR